MQTLPDTESMIDQGILGSIGNTPLVQLRRILKGARFRLFAKIEALNPGGSIKDRPARNILLEALKSGEINSETTIVESSSGNMGIGLAQICAYLGLRLICVIDPKTTSQNVDILRAYGTQIELVTQPDPATGEFLQARITRVEELLQRFPNSFWPDQYSNINNALAHYQTMREIMAELDNQVDYLFCATSSCGTIRGCAEYAREHNPRTKVVAVDAVGSVIFGGQPCKRLIPGHGAAKVPKLHRSELIDECVHVSDLESLVGCRRLVRSEAILAGGSSGAVMSAVERVAHRIPDGATCVMIFPDRGERYLNTIYSDAWVRDYFGDVSELWMS